MANTADMMHRIWSKITALRCNLESLQNERCDDREVIIQESLASVNALIEEMRALEHLVRKGST